MTIFPLNTLANTLFGDGSEISYQEYTAIKNAYRKNNIVFMRKDIIFLDNMPGSA